MKKVCRSLLALCLLLCLLCTAGCFDGLLPSDTPPPLGDKNPGANPNPVNISEIPAYSGSPYVALRGNRPDFTEEEMVTTSFEYYSPLDSLGRCAYTVACIGKDLMPTEDRGSIGQIKPTGWHTVKYDKSIISDLYLYNRCHLIGFQLTGENANRQNLITGTRYLNIDGMLDFENMIADYIKETDNHVLYRVTPIFVGDELVARGVEMEGYSVEDGGRGISFHVFAYNVQPGITIDYATGNSALSGEELPQPGTGGEESGESATYILNKNTKKFHLPSCTYADSMKPENRQEYTGDREDLLSDGFSACGSCKP